MLTRLTALEFQNAVMLDDVLVTLQRAELTTRMAEEIERACVELGEEGRLIRMQLEELVADVPDEKAAVVYDYHADGGAEAHGGGARRARCASVRPAARVRAPGRCSATRATMNPLDHSVSPRGYRVLSHIPRLPDGVVRRVVASLRRARGDRQRVAARAGGGGGRRAPSGRREIREGLRRLQEHNLVDRYLQL